MQSAVQLRNHVVVQVLLKLPAAAALPASSMEALIASLMQRTRRGRLLGEFDTYPDARTLQALCECTAAQQLQPQAVLRLALPALQQMLHFMVLELMTWLPAAQQLDGPAVQQLLETLVDSYEVPDHNELDVNPRPVQWQLRTYELLENLLDLPGAQQLQLHEVTERVLLPAVQTCASDLVARICIRIQLDVTSLEKLLHAALQQGDLVAAVARCDDAPAAAQQLSACSIQSLLEAVLRRKFERRVQMLQNLTGAPPYWNITARQGVAQKLLALPAAQQLPAAAVAALLEAAVEWLLEPVVQQLCALPAAKELDQLQLLKLTQRATQLLMDQAVNMLANTLGSHPAAAQISAEQVAEVLADAMRLRLSEGALIPLDSLLAGIKPPMSSATYMKLLQLAEQQQCLNSVQRLLKMQLAKGIQPAMLLQLVAGAAHELSIGALEVLCKLQAAAQLTAVAILPLLAAAAVEADDGNSPAVIRLLACLPTAADISVEAAQALIAAALQHRLADNAASVCEWLSGANQISAAGVAELLHASFVVNEMGIVNQLCALEGARAIDCGELLQLLQHALRLRHICAVNALLQLPGAEGLSGAVVEDLLLQCVQLRWPKADGRIDPAEEAQAIASRLTAVCKLDVAALLRLLQAAVAHRDVLFLPQLVQQSAAGMIAAADVAALLEAAVRRGDGQLATHLCQLGGAQGLEPDSLQPLLRAALSFTRDSQGYNPQWFCDSPLCDAELNVAVVLLQLPGARRLTGECLQALLQVTITTGHGEHPHDGMRSPAAAALAELLSQSG
jgi:hypothetical protein